MYFNFNFYKVISYFIKYNLYNNFNIKIKTILDNKIYKFYIKNG